MVGLLGHPVGECNVAASHKTIWKDIDRVRNIYWPNPVPDLFKSRKRPSALDSRLPLINDDADSIIRMGLLPSSEGAVFCGESGLAGVKIIPRGDPYSNLIVLGLDSPGTEKLVRLPKIVDRISGKLPTLKKLWH